MKTKLNRRGFTLIEVVAALGIIAVGLVGLLALFPVGIDASARAGDRSAAAVLGEYVIAQLHLRHEDVEPGDLTPQALNGLDWGDYSYAGETHTFDAGASGNFGSGEQIIWQRENPNNPYNPAQPENPNNGLSDQELYSRYEVTLNFDEIVDNSGFTDDNEKYLMQVTVTVRWPRAFSSAERDRQDTLTFVTYIRPKR